MWLHYKTSFCIGHLGSVIKNALLVYIFIEAIKLKSKKKKLFDEQIIILVNSIYPRKKEQVSGSLAVNVLTGMPCEKWAIEQLLNTQIKGFIMSSLTQKL